MGWLGPNTPRRGTHGAQTKKGDASMKSSDENTLRRPRECARTHYLSSPPRGVCEGERRATAALPGEKQRIEGRNKKRRQANEKRWNSKFL